MPTRPPRPTEARGYRLGASYSGNRWLKHARTDLAEIRAAHCDWVLHTFDEVDLRFNRGNLAALTKASQRLGLEVYVSPWAVGGIFGGESISAFGARHPEACQRLSNGEATPYACPFHPAFRRFMREWIQAALASGADVIFWDEPHLWMASWEGRPNKAAVYSVGSLLAQRTWERRRGRKLPSGPGPEVDAYRRWLLLGFLRWATDLVKRLQPAVRNAVCLLPHADPWPNPLWERVAALRGVDIVATDPYWKSLPLKGGASVPLRGWVDLQAARLLDLARRHGKEPQAWVQLFGLRRQDHAKVDQALDLFRQAGIRNIGAWGYQGCAAFSSIASEAPERLWWRLSKGYGRLKQGSRTLADPLKPRR